MGVVEPLKVSWQSGHNIMAVVEPIISRCLFMVNKKSRSRYHGSRRTPRISIFIRGEFKI